jgi:hypothetical protein
VSGLVNINISSKMGLRQVDESDDAVRMVGQTLGPEQRASSLSSVMRHVRDALTC